MKAPFPWFGGKSRVAHIVWERFGDVAHYVEPFAGSLAVLLGRPTAPRTETVNDLDCYVANFWRAVQADREAVVAWADWPVNETDLHARHRWLSENVGFRERMFSDPLYYDVQIAGWWAWGQSTAILGNWLRSSGAQAKPNMHAHGYGVHAATGLDRIRAVGARLRRVRVCCGDWRRLVSSVPTLLTASPCGVFLDPPYADTAARDPNCYVVDSLSVAHDVREWAIEHGNHPSLRIALCGYDGEHDMPTEWTCVSWRAHGGMAHIGAGDSRGIANAERERLWFSPHCLPARASSLLDIIEAHG